MAFVTCKQTEDDGTLSLHCESGLPAPTKYALVMEGECTDADGGMIAVMLHAKGGFLSMLEILKYDNSPILHPPSAADLVVSVWPEAADGEPED